MKTLIGVNPFYNLNIINNERTTACLRVGEFINDPVNHDGVITHLEPDILVCEVRWALESITMNKASGGDGIPAELFQILKDDVVKKLH